MFDINTAVGHWPFRRIPNQTAPALRARLSERGVTGAAVVNTHGLFYKNCQDANLELAEQLAGQRDFFVGVATLNPKYAAWERDLAACHSDLGLQAVRLAPQYHAYNLGSAESVAIAKAATELNMPIFVPQRVVDLRQRHVLDADRMVALEEACALLAAVPGGRLVLTESIVPPASLVTPEGQPKFAGLYFEMSRFRSAYGQQLAALARAAGVDHVLFGSGAPFKSVTPAVLKLRDADLNAGEKEQIAAGNARLLFGLAP